MTALEVLKMAFDCGIDIQVQGDNLHLNAKQAPSNQLLAELKQHKSELLLLLAANESYSPMADGQLKRQSEDKQQPPFSLNNYAHCVTCNQCEHLSLNGSCSRLGKRVNPQALRECDSFQLLKKERPPLEEVKPYTQDELLTHYEKPLFTHLLACPYCHILRGEYCINGYAMGSVYDALLLNRDDAQARRESLALRVDRALIQGRSVFVPFNSSDALAQPTNAPITRKCGNTKEYESFINHWTGCKVCKPSLNRYCAEGQRLEKEANC